VTLSGLEVVSYKAGGPGPKFENGGLEKRSW
jgi:hypothetical protein